MCAELIKHADSTWVERLASVELGINSSVASASGRSPFEVVYGCPVWLPIDLVLSKERDKHVKYSV